MWDEELRPGRKQKFKEQHQATLGGGVVVRKRCKPGPGGNSNSINFLNFFLKGNGSHFSQGWSSKFLTKPKAQCELGVLSSRLAFRHAVPSAWKTVSLLPRLPPTLLNELLLILQVSALVELPLGSLPWPSSALC